MVGKNPAHLYIRKATLGGTALALMAGDRFPGVPVVAGGQGAKPRVGILPIATRSPNRTRRQRIATDARTDLRHGAAKGVSQDEAKRLLHQAYAIRKASGGWTTTISLRRVITVTGTSEKGRWPSSASKDEAAGLLVAAATTVRGLQQGFGWGGPKGRLIEGGVDWCIVDNARPFEQKTRVLEAVGRTAALPTDRAGWWGRKPWRLEGRGAEKALNPRRRRRHSRWNGPPRLDLHHSASSPASGWAAGVRPSWMAVEGGPATDNAG